MHVSMSYKGIRKTPGAEAPGVFDFWRCLRKQRIAQGSGGANSKAVAVPFL
jgi:hypothetical protein